MIPYISIEPLNIGPLAASPFGILVGISIFAGVELSLWRGRRLGLNPSELGSLLLALLIGGLIGGHVFDSLLYYPREVAAEPIILLEIWNGLSSFGGFAGALLAVLVWKYYEKRATAAIGKFQLMRPVRRSQPAPLLPYLDAVFSIFPIVWVIGRIGCAIVHDHPGIPAPAGSWLAVASGPGPIRHFGLISLQYGSQPTYDLGLLEMIFSAILAVIFALLWSSKRAIGWYIATTCILYAPARFLLDFLRAGDLAGGDIRYAALTPAQWACIAVFVFGIALAMRIHGGGEKDKS